MDSNKKYCDLHMHSQCSDGTDSVEELIEAIKKNNISIFSVTDHDTVDFYARVSKKATEGLWLIPGIEFSCRANAGKCHILGYGIDTENAAIHSLLAKGQRRRKEKAMARILYLKEQGISFTEEEITALMANKTVGKPHIAALLVKKGAAESIEAAFTQYLRSMPEKNDRIPAAEAIEAIKESGGIAVWAHPLGGEGEKHLTEDAFFSFFAELKGYGIQGLESFYARYSDAEQSFLINVATTNRLLISGGSDYHGKAKTVPLLKDLYAEKLTILTALT